MEFKEFNEAVKKRVENAMPEKSVTISTITKNNNTKMTALHISSKNNVVPTIYLEGFYDQYCNGRKIYKIVTDIINTYHKALNNPISDSFNFSNFSDLEKIKDNIFFTFINANANKELLVDIPHIIWNDLAIIFKCMVSKEETGVSSFTISNRFIEIWKTTTNHLLTLAHENTPKIFPGIIKSMKDVLFGLTENKNILDDLDNLDDELPMYIATNNAGINGSHVLLYPNLLEKFSAKCGKNFYIFPSSIHECILVPEDKNTDVNEFRKMVKEVNATQLLPEEVLSDNVYYYDRASGEIKVA